MVQLTNEQAVKVFNEWMRRYTDEPKQFEAQFQTINEYLKDKSEGREPTYGEFCAMYVGEFAKDLGFVS